MSIVLLSVPAVMSVILFIFFALDWKDERKRRHHQENTEMSSSSVNLTKEQIDELISSIRFLNETSKSLAPIATSDSVECADELPAGTVMEYLGEDGTVEPVPVNGYTLPTEFPIQSPERIDAPTVAPATIDEIFREGHREDFMVSPSMVKDFKQMYLYRPDDMFRTVEGEQIIVRRFHKNLLRKLVGASDDYNLTVNGYVDNILHSHFMLYKDEINSLLSDNDRADLKRDPYDWA